VDEDQEDKAKSGKAAPPAKKKNTVLLVVVGAVLAIGTSSAAGAVFGPSLVTGSHPAAPAGEKGEKGEKGGAEEAAAETADLEPLIVDIRETGGDLHHLKVGIAIELTKAIPEEEFKRYVPRVRDAAIGYLRSLTFDDVTSPTKFDSIRAELGERIAAALGKDRVKRVLFTDFVAQ
jgi:flagellar basal body-associated protein FliL